MKATQFSLIAVLALSLMVISIPAFAQEEGGEASVETSDPASTSRLAPDLSKKHQLEFGLGWGWLGAIAWGGSTEGGFYPAIGLGWLNIPMMYHHRWSPLLAFGGGLQITLLFASGAVGGSANAVGGVRIYAIKDFLWFDANILLGFPIIFGLAPAIGHTFMFTEKIGLQVKNEFMLGFLPSFFGDSPVLFTWITSVALEIRF